MADPFDLSGRVAVVTAGCGGLGRTVAELLARQGARVVATSRDSGRADEARARWAAEGLDIATAVLDFSAASYGALVDRVVAEQGGLHLLVNNAAGRFPGRAPEETSPEDLLADFSASVLPSFQMAQAAVAARARTAITAIVNVGSIYGALAVDHRIYEDPSRQSSVSYAVAKGGLVQMTRYLAAYWAPLGVRVNCVSPGGVRRAQTPGFLANYNSRVPMARMAEAGEVAGTIAYLLSAASGYVTGENIMVDGGLHVW